MNSVIELVTSECIEYIKTTYMAMCKQTVLKWCIYFFLLSIGASVWSPVGYFSRYRVSVHLVAGESPVINQHAWRVYLHKNTNIYYAINIQTHMLKLPRSHSRVGIYCSPSRSSPLLPV
ncbi:hypothetical protein FKM82_013918 [Ascaphus truei]